jgi:caa(3)-type oxidase subunit IV
MSEHAEPVKVYVMVFVGLAVLTIATVLAWAIGSHFKFSPFATVSIGLLIATVKGSLVALFFMHLSKERKLIYASLLLAGFFCSALLVLPLFCLLDSYASPEHLYYIESSEQVHGP